ncbi:MAG: PEP-CTERM sorting domain-containing protein [Pseudomonadota bacterium]
MKQAHVLLSLFVGLVVMGMVGTARAELILDLDPGGVAGPCGFGCGNVAGATFGWGFEVTSAIDIDGIGVWDADGDGIGTTVEAGLWAADGTLLASATISDASMQVASNGDGFWLFEDIGLQSLAPGFYVIGNVFFDDVPLAQFFAPFTLSPSIANIQERVNDVPDSGLAFPSVALSDDQGIFGPTLRLATQVPEPSSLALFVIALGGLGFSLMRGWRA